MRAAVVCSLTSFRWHTYPTVFKWCSHAITHSQRFKLTHSHTYIDTNTLLSLWEHFSLNLALAHTLFVSIRLISLIEFSLLCRVWLDLRHGSWNLGFRVISQTVWGRVRAQTHQTWRCVYFFMGWKQVSSVWIKAKRNCQSFQATHTRSLWSLRLSPYLPCPSCRFIWMPLWCTCKCKFKAVSPCPRLIHWIEGRLHLPWFPQWCNFSVMHSDKTLTWLCFHPFQFVCLSGYLITLWSAQTLFGQGRRELSSLIDQRSVWILSKRHVILEQICVTPSIFVCLYTTDTNLYNWPCQTMCGPWRSHLQLVCFSTIWGCCQV